MSINMFCSLFAANRAWICFVTFRRLLRSAGVKGLGLGLPILPSFVTLVAPMRS